MIDELIYKLGLSDEDIEIRKSKKLVNYDTTIKTNSIFQIIFKHVFTLFNFLNITLAIIIFVVGSYKNCLFIGIVFLNTIIGIIQEIKSKKIIDKLSILTNTKVNVIRNRKLEEIQINDIVLDDIIYFKLGNQVVTDSIIINGECLVNESFITGESELIYRKKGDTLLSGSFIVSGECVAKVIHIGEENYTSIISKEAKYIKKVNSEIMISLKKIIKFISIIIVPLGLLFLFNQLSIPNNSLNIALVNMVAAMVGMIPDGLVLLTSTVLVVSIIKLSYKNVLVQELYCIETLARVDTICLDKTGTLTTGNISLEKVINYANDIDDVMNAITSNASIDNNTMKAINKKYNSKSDWVVENIKNFSSDSKYLKITFKGKGTYFLGAVEAINIKLDKIKKCDIDKYASEYRIVSLVKDTKLQALFLFKDEIRISAINTIKYLKKQNVDIKIISGDNPITVSNISKRFDINNNDNYIDMTNVSDEEIKNIALKYTIFGRVTPKQKKQIILALKEKNKTVAMVGDGVNDVLALKEADSSIALNSGAEAAINASQIVLLDSDFSSVPSIISEGRRTINNVERSSTLFLSKTMYNTILMILFIFININYPIIPIQLTLISVFTIGIPAFILSLEPNNKKVKSGFIKSVLQRALPISLTVVINIIITIIVSKLLNLSSDELTTISVLITAFSGFYLLYKLCIPFNKLRKILLISLIFSFAFMSILFNKLFSLVILSLPLIGLLFILMITSIFIIKLLTKLLRVIKVI